MSPRAAVGTSVLLGVTALAGEAAAADAESRERRITTGEIEQWLDSEPGQKPVDKGAGEEDEEPLPGPRRHGVIVESGIGFENYLGDMKHITPVAPWFQVRVGFEPLSFVMIFIEADSSFASTAYASAPPPPRSFFHYGAGAGVRLSYAFSDLFGLLAQGSLGFATISEQNVLSVYGYPDADEPNLYMGLEGGFEWYPVDPHLALGVRAGIRTYGDGLTRDRGGGPPLALLGSAQIRYTF
ncbi:MAG TPA: hypothetical protein VF103_19385 [Polyangiaceae bacterium]